MNIIDRTISFFAPEAGLRREFARKVLSEVRVYDGAHMGRRTENWRATNASANAAIKGSLPRLRARSRDVMCNTWWGPRIREVVDSYAVGYGIVPRFKTGNASLDQRAARLWREWGKSCDFEQQLDINGLISLAVGTIVEAGEVLIRKVPVSPAAGRKVPLEIQLLEPDHLDGARDQLRVTTDGIIDQGIEYLRDGKRVAYWLLPEHPGAAGGLHRPSVRVPARDILHVYRKLRIGQGRGVPWVAPVLLKGRDVADLEEAITVKARVEACLSVFVKTTDPVRSIGSSVRHEPSGRSGSRRIETLSPGTVNYLDQGEEIGVVSPSSSLAFDSVLINTWMTLAAGAGLTYDQMTGDLRQANYSSLKAGDRGFKRFIEKFQHLTLVPMLLDPLAEAFAEAAMDAGALPRRVGGYPVEWIMPGWEPIDPLKDMQADILAVRSGRMTWPQFVAAWGFDPDQQLDEVASWQRSLDEKKVVLDTDPRRGAHGVKGAPSSDDPSAKDEADAAEQSG